MYSQCVGKAGHCQCDVRTLSSIVDGGACSLSSAAAAPLAALAMRSAHYYCSSAPDAQLRCSQLRGLHCCDSGASATPQAAAAASGAHALLTHDCAWCVRACMQAYAGLVAAGCNLGTAASNPACAHLHPRHMCTDHRSEIYGETAC
eukprot:COSAG02_NODE_910_length_16005_cov_46.458569_11_plen_147_part_00